MNKLYFIRHGESVDNVARIFSEPAAPLTDKGRGDAHQAGRETKAAGLHFDAIVCSPYPRAAETAHILAEEIGFPAANIEVYDLLGERRFGELTGKSSVAYLNGEREYKEIDLVKGAETVAAMQERAAKALDTLRARPEGTILVVSHNAFGRALRRVINNVPYTDEYRDRSPHDPIPNTTIVELI